MPLVMLLVLLGPLILFHWDFLYLNVIKWNAINFSSTGTFLHFISYAFSSAGTINFSSTGTFFYLNALVLLLVPLGPFCT